ncbi:hypothetical protein BC332_33610 [Capsicum chinense]|nr:hypothetical protein BC332_33610 [Capsicum chinense]
MCSLGVLRLAVQQNTSTKNVVVSIVIIAFVESIYDGVYVMRDYKLKYDTNFNLQDKPAIQFSYTSLIDGPIDLLKYTNTNEESFVAFNKKGDKRVHEWNEVAIKGSKDGHFNEAPTITESVELENEAAPAQSTTNQVVASIGEASSAAEATIVDVDDGLPILASDHSIKNSSDSDYQDLFVEDDGEFKSDVHKDDIRTDIKCDSIDNNTIESFNGWILGPKHKTIVTMLEEIRVKDSVGPSGVVVGPSDVPSTTRPRERPKNTPPTTDAPPRPRGRLRKTSDNPEIGLPSSMILHTGSTQPIRSVDITGDLGYKSKIGGK